jgi:hypothetical protein
MYNSNYVKYPENKYIEIKIRLSVWELGVEE